MLWQGRQTTRTPPSTRPRKGSNMTPSFSIDEPSDFRNSPSYIASQRAKHRKAAEAASSNSLVAATMIPDLDSVYEKVNSKFEASTKKVADNNNKMKHETTPLLKQSSKAKDASVAPSASTKGTPKSHGKKEHKSNLKALLASRNTPISKLMSSEDPPATKSSKKKNKTEQSDSANTKLDERKTPHAKLNLSKELPATKSSKKKNKDKKSLQENDVSTKLDAEKTPDNKLASGKEPQTSKSSEKKHRAKEAAQKDSDGAKPEEKKTPDVKLISSEDAPTTKSSKKNKNGAQKLDERTNPDAELAGNDASPVAKSSKKKSKDKSHPDFNGTTKLDKAAAARPHSSFKNKGRKDKQTNNTDEQASVLKPMKKSKKREHKARKRAREAEAAAAADAALMLAKDADSLDAASVVEEKEEPIGPTEHDPESGGNESSEGEKQKESTKSSSDGSESESSAEDTASKKSADNGNDGDGGEPQAAGSEDDDMPEKGPVTQVVEAMTKKPRKNKCIIEFKSVERVDSAEDKNSGTSEDSGSEADDESEKVDDPSQDDRVQVMEVSGESDNESETSADHASREFTPKTAPGSPTAVPSEPSVVPETESDRENDADSESEAASENGSSNSESSSPEAEATEESKTATNPRKRKRVDSATTPSSVASRNPLPDLMQFPSVAAAVAGVHNPTKKLKKTPKPENDKRKAADTAAYSNTVLKLMAAFEDILPDYKSKGDKRVDANVRLAALLENARNTVLRLSADRVKDNGGPSRAMQMQLTRIAKEREEEVASLRGQVWELMEERTSKKAKKER